MKKEATFFMPNPYMCFATGLMLGLVFFGVVYIGCNREWWSAQRLVGQAEKQVQQEQGENGDLGGSGKFGKSIYLFLYILLFWGLAFIFSKSGRTRHEQKGLLHLEQKFPSSRIISERNELESLKVMISHGPEGTRIRNTAVGQILLFLIDHCLVVGTSERIVEIFTRRMDTLQKNVESSYNMLRYIAWAIPSIGFIGTVLGIGAALAKANMAMSNIRYVTQPLGMAFDTTLIALVESVVLMFFIYNMQHKEEKLLNDIDLFCQEKFIINLRLEQNGAK